MTNLEYHSRGEISKSDLDLIALSPLHYKQKWQNRDDKKTQAMILGDATHRLILEPDEFNKEFIVTPNVDRRTKAGKEAYAEFEKNSADKTILTHEVYADAKAMSEMVLGMKQTGAFLRDGKAEQSYFSELEGVKVKCRPDFYNEKLGLIIDLKTIGKDAIVKNFESTLANFNYHMQVAFYSDILRSLGKAVNEFLFIVVESKRPHYVGFYRLDEFSINEGRQRYIKLLEKYKWCVENDNWHGYAKLNDSGSLDIVQTVSLPAWKQYEEIG